MLIKNILLFFAFVGLAVFQGCYTQIATHHIVEVPRSAVVPPTQTYEPRQAPTDSITNYIEPELKEYHYHFYDYNNSCFGGCPDYYTLDYSINIYTGWDYYWRPTYYPPRPWRYAYRYYWRYPAYCSYCYDPFYYDFSCSHHRYWDYSPHYYNSWYHTGDPYYESNDNDKREWGRREDTSPGRNIHRPSYGSSVSGGSANNTFAPEGQSNDNSARSINRTKPKDEKQKRGGGRRNNIKRNKNRDARSEGTSRKVNFTKSKPKSRDEFNNRAKQRTNKQSFRSKTKKQTTVFQATTSVFRALNKLSDSSDSQNNKKRSSSKNKKKKGRRSSSKTPKSTSRR